MLRLVTVMMLWMSMGAFAESKIVCTPTTPVQCQVQTEVPLRVPTLNDWLAIAPYIQVYKDVHGTVHLSGVLVRSANAVRDSRAFCVGRDHAPAQDSFFPAVSVMDRGYAEVVITTDGCAYVSATSRDPLAVWLMVSVDGITYRGATP